MDECGRIVSSGRPETRSENPGRLDRAEPLAKPTRRDRGIEMRLSGRAGVLSLVLALAASGTIVGAQEPGVDSGPLPGVDLVTEEVEPGVFHVVGDGVRELSRPVEFVHLEEWGWGSPGSTFRVNAAESAGLAANQEGVWLYDRHAIVRLGQEDVVWEPKPGNHTPSFRVAPDGTLYEPFATRVLVDGAWKLQRPRVSGIDSKDRGAMLFAPDGTLWFRGTNGREDSEERPRLARRDEDGWTLVPPPPWPPERPRDKKSPRIGAWGVAADGTLYVQRHSGDIQRYDGDRWETLERPARQIDRLHVGPDGTIWVERQDAGLLMKLGAEGWNTYEVAAPIRLVGLAQAAVASDGAYWYTPLGDPMVHGACDGIMRTDGDATSHYLPGLCVLSLAPGPEGTVWVQALEWTGDYLRPEAIGRLELYAIDPSA
jgi:hypothetical protein